MNLVPHRYRSVSVTDVVDVKLDEEGLRAHFQGRPAYRRTKYIVVRSGDQTAVVEIDKRTEKPLFSEIIAVRRLAGPGETAYVRSPNTDVAVPSQLARAAVGLASGTRCVVVEGRYQHVNLILDPAPIRVHVVEVAPPWPPKLVDQVNRVVDLADDLPPIEFIPDVIDLTDLARLRPSTHYLLPCRGSGVQIEGADVAFLDQVPQRADWTLVGCARSREIHRWFYGDDPPTVEMCPRELTIGQHPPVGSVILTKCCMLEEGIERDGNMVVVPWGASLGEIRSGIAAAVDIAAGKAAAPAS